ncbi:hypothetical protein L0244_37195 [bacterium]|nr:hypothetical protein [bacterium]
MIQQQNGSYNVDGFVITKSQGRLICQCSQNRCSHVAQLSTYLKHITIRHNFSGNKGCK